MSLLDLSEQEILRRESLKELRAMGIDPYPAAEYVVTDYSTNIKSEFSDDAPRKEVSIAGRIMSRRIMGKASFMELQDSKGRVQVYISRDDLCPDENRICTTLSSRNCLTSVTLWESRVMCSAPKWERSLSMRLKSLF